MSPRRIAFFSLIISSVLWASSGTIAKILIPSIDPIPLGMLRVGVATAVLIPLFLLKKHPPILTALRDIWPVALGAAGNFVFFFLGVSRTTANAAAIMYTITPLLTFYVARKTIQEYTNPKKILGIVIGFLGMVFILLLPVIEKRQSLNGDFIGNLLILCAVLSWTYYIVGSRKLTTQKKYEPLTITTMSMTISFIILTILTFLTPHRPILAAALSGFHPLLILFYGIVVTVVTFGLHQWTIKHSSATTASLTNYLQPVFSFSFNALFIGEKITIEFLIGSIFVLVGTMTATGANIIQVIKTLRRR